MTMKIYLDCSSRLIYYFLQVNYKIPEQTLTWRTRSPRACSRRPV